MKMISLNEEPIGGLSLEAWIKLYDTPIRPAYGIEYLTAARTGSAGLGKPIMIPDSGRYALPDGMSVSYLEDKMEEAASAKYSSRSESKIRDMIRVNLNSTIKRWEAGRAPHSIKSMDMLRDHGNEEFLIDFISTMLYDRTTVSQNNVTYGLKSLPGIAYLFASALIAAGHGNACLHSGESVSIALNPSSRLSARQLREKLKGICKGSGNRVHIIEPFSHVLSLIGIPKGRLVQHRYSNLGLGFIDDLVTWIEDGQLGDDDSCHAGHALRRFAEAFVDHRYTPKENAGAYIFLPYFRSKRTSSQFKELFLRLCSIVMPDVKMHPNDQKRPTKKGRIYRTTLYVPLEHTKEVESISMAA